MSFMRRTLKIVESSDIVLEVLDARFPQLTRNEKIEKTVLGSGKKLILVLNKSDLVSMKTAAREKKILREIASSVFVSSTKKKGILRLKKALGKAAGKKKVKVAIVGYPNTGKSSIINALCGKKVAETAQKAGFTRGEKFVRVSEKVLLIDLPGVIPFKQKDEFSLALINAKSVENLKDVEGCALKLIDFLKKQGTEEVYGVKLDKEAEEILEKIALKTGKLLKKGLPNTNAAAKMLLRDWQKGRIRV